MGRLATLYEQGRRFDVFETVEQGDVVVVGVRISQPDWSGPVEVFKRFTFRPDADVVSGMQDCTGREDALSGPPTGA